MLATLMIGHALIPARTIIDGLRRLQQGDLSWRLPRFRTAEFNLIARAFNELSEDLTRTNAARAALTTRLFQVQEEERRALAKQVAIDIYRIAQECPPSSSTVRAIVPRSVTAVKHGTPTEVRLSRRMWRRASSPLAPASGGGDAARINREQGHGIFGMRERIAALGGNLSIEKAKRGVRVSAIIPVIVRGTTFAIAEAAA